MSNQLTPANRNPGTGLIAISATARTSISPADHAGKVAIYRAMVGQDFRADEMLGEEIVVANVVIHTVKLPDERTGELKDCQRTILVTPDGMRIGTVSDGVAGSVEALTVLFGPLPWSPPQKCIISEQKGRSGRKYYVLEPVA